MNKKKTEIVKRQTNKQILLLLLSLLSLLCCFLTTKSKQKHESCRKKKHKCFDWNMPIHARYYHNFCLAERVRKKNEQVNECWKKNAAVTQGKYLSQCTREYCWKKGKEWEEWILSYFRRAPIYIIIFILWIQCMHHSLVLVLGLKVKIYFRVRILKASFIYFFIYFFSQGSYFYPRLRQGKIVAPRSPQRWQFILFPSQLIV